MMDKNSIGLTPEERKDLEAIMETGWFGNMNDVGRFCLAFAIRAKVPPVPGPRDNVTTVWSALQFDKTGEIHAVVVALYPECETPFRLMEHFIVQGLNLVRAQLDQGPVWLLDPDEPVSAS